jgi:hypothetical protein
MEGVAEAAVRAGDDVFPADDFRKRSHSTDDHQFRLFDGSGGVANGTRNQDLPGREFDVAPFAVIVRSWLPDALGGEVSFFSCLLRGVQA